MEYGKYETLARAGYSGAARPQGDWQTSAALTRQQYDDWRTRYLPRVARLADLGENNSLMNAQLARVGGLATSSLRTAQMAQDNQMARYGVSPTVTHWVCVMLWQLLARKMVSVKQSRIAR